MRFFYLILSVLTVLLFVGGPGYESHRIYQSVWNLGHVFLFSGFSFLLLNTSVLKRHEQSKKLIIIVCLSFSLGLAIEFLQLFVGRSFEIIDIVSDIAGALIGYLIYELTKNNISVLRKKVSTVILAIVILFCITPILKVCIDEYQMREDFPILADFESLFQITRWDVRKTKLALTKKHVKQGLRSLQVIFLPDEFPDISLQHFPRNWSGYKNIQLSIYNNEKFSFIIEMKIYDTKHIANGHDYNDRFNKEFLLHPGWNDILVPLDEVFTSPLKRNMDKTNIKSFSIFLKSITTPITIFIDDLKLT